MASTTLAQKAPGLGYVYPPAIPIGRATEVQLGGYDFTDDMQWFVHHERVRLQVLGLPGEHHLPPPPYWIGPRSSTTAIPIPREVAGRIMVDRDLPEGLVRWQVANANGCSETALFYLSRGYEVVESRSRDFPQRIGSLPVGVSGRLSRLTEVDQYEWTADRDGPITVDLMARRLGSDFYGMLQVHDAAGKRLADFADTQGLDGGVTFLARSGESYTIRVHDVDFRGDRAYVYRLAITPGAKVVCMVPAAGQRGTSRDVEFVGFGFATGKPLLESVRQTISFPADPASKASSHSVPTFFGPVAAEMRLSDFPETTGMATQPESPQTPVSLETPGAVTCRLPPAAEEHRYAWQVGKDETWQIELQSRAIGGRLDVALLILGPDGKPAGDSDDQANTPDARVELRTALSGTYTCIVRDRSARAGSLDEVYRLHIERQTQTGVPDFTLAAPQQVQVPLGGKSEVTIQARRLGGFDGEIAISITGLPEGVTVSGPSAIPAGKNEWKLTLAADANAAVVASPIQFRGTGKLADSTPRVAASLLAMTMVPPIEVRVVDRERQHEVHRGTTFLAELELIRKSGFTGEIQLEMCAQQSRNRQGIRGPIVRVPADATRATYPCFMPEWLGTELTRRMMVQGVAGVRDPKGHLRYLIQPAGSRITMIMEGALLKLTAEAVEPAVRIGESIEVPVAISRSAKLPLEAVVRLVVPDEVAGLLHAEPVVLPPGQDRGTLRICSVADGRLAGPWSLKLTATALQDGQWPVVSECPVQLRFAEP